LHVEASTRRPGLIHAPLVVLVAAGRVGQVELPGSRGNLERDAKALDPARRAKIAVAKRGKPRPPHVHTALLKEKLGRKASAATRAKMSASHKARGTWPPAAKRTD